MMKSFLREHISILLAIALPIGLIGIIAIYSTLPSLFVSTEYNFLYATCSENRNYYSYYCNNYLQQRYSVENGNLQQNTISPEQDTDTDGMPDVDENYGIRFFIHNTDTNKSQEITESEAMQLHLSDLLASPDDATVSKQYNHGADIFLFFNTGSSHGIYLVQGSGSIKMNVLPGTNDGYYNNFNFLGWILP